MSAIQQHNVQYIESYDPEIPDWFYFLFGIMLVFFSGIEAKGQNLNFNNSVSPELIVCEGEENFTIEFTNTSTGILSNVEILLELPIGVEYVSASILESSTFNVQESDISNLSAVLFSSNDLSSGGTITFSFDAIAKFDAYTNQLNGNVFSNQVTVNYSGNSEFELTDAYNILYPALSITQIAPIISTCLLYTSPSPRDRG